MDYINLILDFNLIALGVRETSIYFSILASSDANMHFLFAST